MSTDPLHDFMESTAAFYESHRKIMLKNLKTPDSSSRMLAHACILATLDFHKEASGEELEKAGVWLWSKFHPYPKKNREKWIAKFYDSQVISLQLDQTPRSLSSRGARALRSLPKKSYLDYNTVLTLHREAEKLDDTMAKLKMRLKVHSRFLADDVVLSLVLHCALNEILRDGNIKLKSWDCFNTNFWFSLISPWSIMHCQYDFESCLVSCFEKRQKKYQRWIMLIPDSPSNGLLDFALLCFPENNDPPILLPVMITHSLLEEQPCDMIFRNGSIVDNDLHIYPLLDSFNRNTGGKGRVQFIWIVKDSQDLSKLITDGIFDADTWFTTTDEWKKIYDSRFDTIEHPRFAPPFHDIGYSSKNAVTAACEKFAKKRKIMKIVQSKPQKESKTKHKSSKQKLTIS